MHNRLSGLVMLLFGILLLLVVIPRQTEIVDYGWLRPATLPSIAATIMAVAGAFQLIIPKGHVEPVTLNWLRAFYFLSLGASGLWGMHAFGFPVAAPVMMLAIMLSLGERRWLWLFTGAILLPAFIWFCIDFLLKRPLP